MGRYYRLTNVADKFIAFCGCGPRIMIIRVLGAVLLLIVVGLAWRYGWFDYLTVDNLRGIQVYLGMWAPLAFVVAFVIGELIQVPSIFWILCAGLIWPWWIALPLAFVAALLAATGAFLLARYILGDRFHEKLPRQFVQFNEGLKSSPLKAVVMIRLTTFLHPLVHWLLAASPIRLPMFLLGTALGILPGVIAIVLLGQTFVLWWDEYAVWLVTGAVALVALYWVYHSQTKSRKPVE